MDIYDFLQEKFIYAIVGVSINEEKWGYRIFSTMKKTGYKVYPVNPKYEKIGNEKCYKSLREIPEKIDVVISVVPPIVTGNIARECIELGIDKLWMQPGSESDIAEALCKDKEIQYMKNVCFVVDAMGKEFV